MGRHHQQQSRRRGYVAHLALGAATVAGMLGGGGVAVALQAAPAPVLPAFPTTAPAAVTPVVAPVPTTTASPRTSSSSTVAKPTATKKSTTKKAVPVCDLSGPPEFGDPSHPDVITNRNCGYVDSQGRERSRDRWIDDQLLDAAAN